MYLTYNCTGFLRVLKFSVRTVYVCKRHAIFVKKMQYHIWWRYDMIASILMLIKFGRAGFVTSSVRSPPVVPVVSCVTALLETRPLLIWKWYKIGSEINMVNFQSVHDRWMFWNGCFVQENNISKRSSIHIYIFVPELTVQTFSWYFYFLVTDRRRFCHAILLPNRIFLW